MKRILVAGIVLALAALTAAFVYQHYLRPPPLPPPDATELESLRLERDALQRRLLTAVDADASLRPAPRGSLMVGMPQLLARDLVARAVAEALAATGLPLRDLRAHRADTVKVKTALGTQALGTYELELRVHELRSGFEPGPARARLAGATMALTLPLAASGSGRGTLRLRWNPAQAGGAGCPGLDLRRALRLDVVPARVSVSAAIQLSASGGSVSAVAKVRELPLRLRVEPTGEAWKAVDELLAAQSGECRALLKRIDVPRALRTLLAPGFAATLPGRSLAAGGLPAGLRSDVEASGREPVALALKPLGLEARAGRLWYGADVTVRR